MMNLGLGKAVSWLAGQSSRRRASRQNNPFAVRHLRVANRRFGSGTAAPVISWRDRSSPDSCRPGTWVRWREGSSVVSSGLPNETLIDRLCAEAEFVSTAEIKMKS